MESIPKIELDAPVDVVPSKVEVKASTVSERLQQILGHQNTYV